MMLYGLHLRFCRCTLFLLSTDARRLLLALFVLRFVMLTRFILFFILLSHFVSDMILVTFHLRKVEWGHKSIRFYILLRSSPVLHLLLIIFHLDASHTSLSIVNLKLLLNLMQFTLKLAHLSVLISELRLLLVDLLLQLLILLVHLLLRNKVLFYLGKLLLKLVSLRVAGRLPEVVHQQVEAL